MANMKHSCSLIIIICSGFGLLLAATDTAPTASDNQPTLSGAWRGTGFVQDNKGQKERVKCRARYDASGLNQYRVMMKCVSRTNGSKAKNFSVTKAGKRQFSGRFRDEETNILVNAVIRLKGKKQVVELSSRQGWGRFELRK